MNLFRFLKSTCGAIKPLNALVISGAAGLAFAYVANDQADKQIEAQRAVRSVSSIGSTAPQASLHYKGRHLTSINVHDSRNQMATAEERAAMNQDTALARYVKNQQALANMEQSLGRAAGLGAGDDGLNAGNRDVAVGAATRIDTREAENNARAAAVSHAYKRGAQQGEQAGGNKQQFTSATMTRSSGSGANNTFTPGVSSFSGQSGATGSGEGQRISGAMPQGSNIVSQMGLNGALAQGGRASFGRERDGRVNRANRTRGDGSELRDILKRSAAADANVNKSANEGGTAFLRGNTSGGVEVDGGDAPGSSANTVSDDLTAPTDKKLKAIGDRLDEEEEEQEKRQEEQKSLIIQLLATLVGSVGMMVLGAHVLQKLQGPWRWIVAGAMVAAVAVANALLFIKAKEFIEKYSSSGGVGIGWLACIIAPVLVAGMTYVAITPEGWKALWQKIWSGFKKRFDLAGIATNQIMNS